MRADLGGDPVHVGQQAGGEDLVRRPVGDDAALAQHVQAVAVVRGEVQVVQGEQGAGAEGGHQGEDVELVADVEVVGRLVEDEQGRLLHERPRDQDALSLTAGERCEGTIPQLRDAHPLQRLAGAGGVARRVGLPEALVR